MRMLRHIYKLIFTAASICLAVGCSESIELPEEVLSPGDPGTLTVKLTNSTYTRNAQSDNSETLIGTLKICLYDSYNDDAPAIYSRTFTPAEHNSTTIVMSLSDELVEKLFNAESAYKCRMYAVANVEGITDKPSVNDIKNHVVISDFQNTAIQTSFAMAGEGVVIYTPSEDPTEKGSAQGEGKLYRTAAKIRLNISVPESIEVKDNDGNTVETWKPETGDGAMRVMLNNGVQNAPVVTQPGWEPEDESAYYSSTSNRQSYRTFTAGLGTEKYTFGTQVPFYTYPNVWEEAEEESHKTTLTLMVAWRKDSGSIQQMYYQVPVTPGTMNEIVSNYSYTINMNVGMLGSPNPDMAVLVEDVSYQIVNWATEDINIDIKDYRYLVVNPNVYTIDNINEIVIPYYSSHPVVITDVSVNYQRFNFYAKEYDTKNVGQVVDLTIPKDIIDKSVVVNSNNEVVDTIVNYSLEQNPLTKQLNLRVKHDLEIWNPVDSEGKEVSLTGNMTPYTDVEKTIVRYERPENPEEPYSPYIIKVTIAHADNDKYSEEITIIQRPAMYIEPFRNPGDGTSEYGNGQKVTVAVGNVIVNNGFGVVDGDALGSMNDYLYTLNANPNMYVVTVSQLNIGSQYSIGDPRTQFYTNDLSGNGTMATPTANGTPAGSYTPNWNANKYNQSGIGNEWSRSSPALYPPGTTGRTLSYYYPTIEDNVDYEYMVAPQFRVASSYGETIPVNRQGARRRMATYQELNCPAGRWRLPTVGELEYIVSLSNSGKIPLLYTPGDAYWTSRGAYMITSDGISYADPQPEKASVRGVYDEWYWSQYPEYYISPDGTNYIFTLGDMPRTVQ